MLTPSFHSQHHYNSISEITVQVSLILLFYEFLFCFGATHLAVLGVGVQGAMAAQGSSMLFKLPLKQVKISPWPLLCFKNHCSASLFFPLSNFMEMCYLSFLRQYLKQTKYQFKCYLKIQTYGIKAL